jgi:hypothetical protein
VGNVATTVTNIDISPSVLIAFIITLTLAIMGYLTKRMIDGLDRSIRALSEEISGLAHTLNNTVTEVAVLKQAINMQNQDGHEST